MTTPQQPLPVAMAAPAPQSRGTVGRALDAVFSSRGLLVGLLLIAAAAGAAFIVGGGSSRTVSAYFADANGLVPGEDVRVAGIRAGSIESVSTAVDPSGKAVAQAQLSIDAAHWPLHQGTRLAVRPMGALSNVYVDLTPGPSSAAELSGSQLNFGLDTTTSPVNLDELSNVFDPDVRTSIRTQIQEGVIVFGDGGAATTNQLIQRLNPLTANLDPVTQTLAARSPELDRLNGEFATIVRELGSQDANLRGLIANGDTTLGALAAKQLSLQNTLVHAQGTLASIDTGLSGEQSNLQALFQKGPVSLDKTKQAADVLTPLIANVNPYIPDLNVLLEEFTSATGFLNQTPNNLWVDTLRVDAQITNPSGRAALPCGGEPAEQPTCPYRPNLAGNGGGGSGGASGGSTGTSPGGSAPSQAPSSTGTGYSDFGGMFQ